MPEHLNDDDLKEIEEVKSQLEDLADKQHKGEPGDGVKKEDIKAAFEEIREDGEKEGKKAALRSLLYAMSEEDDRQKLHDAVDASDDEDMKEEMNNIHQKKDTGLEAMDPEDYLKQTKHTTDAAIMAQNASLQARIAYFEDKEKAGLVEDLVALKASIVPNVDEDRYRQLLMQRDFQTVEGWHQGRADEIEAMKARQLVETTTGRAPRTQQHPTFAFNARDESRGSSKLTSLDAVFDGYYDGGSD